MSSSYTTRRWQQMDFVVGQEIHLSGNHTCKGKDGKPHKFEDMCDKLAGKYPKDFKFTSWHPHCRCYASCQNSTKLFLICYQADLPKFPQ